MGKDPKKPHQLGGPGKSFLTKNQPPKLLNFHCHDNQSNKTCLPDLNLDLTLSTPPASSVLVEERQRNHIN